MTDLRNTRVPQFFLTPGGPCPYLPGKVERKVFARLTGPLAQPLSEALTHSGFRRSQMIAYRQYPEGLFTGTPDELAAYTTCSPA